MAEFFGFGGALGEPEGYLSWQHLTFVLSMNLIVIALAIFFGSESETPDSVIDITGDATVEDVTPEEVVTEE